MTPRVPHLFLTFPLAMAAAACSDPPPTPAALGISMTLSAADPTKVMNLGSRACHAGTASAFTYKIGQPVAGKTIEDGVKNVKIECLVQGNGSFSANGGGTDENGKKPMSFSLGGSIKDNANRASNLGSMSFFSPDTSGMATATGFPPCEIGPVQTRKKGALLTDFYCPYIGATDDTTSACEVEGTIALEYCKTGEEED